MSGGGGGGGSSPSGGGSLETQDTDGAHEVRLLPGAASPRLLRSLISRDDPSFLRVHIVEAGKPRLRQERMRLEELVAELWPDAGREESRPRQSDWVRSMCRDIRLLDDPSNQSFLLKATCRAILVRTDFLKAVVEPQRVTFLNSDSPMFDVFVQEFLADTRWNSKTDPECNFGDWAVECIVCACVTLHDMRFKLISPVGNHILESTRSTDFNSVLRLYPLKLTLSAFVEQLRPMVKCLHDLLHWDEECERVRSRGVRRHGSHPEWGFAADFDASSLLCASLEEALDNWYHNAEEIMADAVEMCQRIEDNLRFAEASMSCTRNRLLKFELWTMIATVAFGVGALISGVFGMNLDNYGLNNAPGVFWHVSLLITVLIGVITLVGWYAVNRSQSHYSTHAPQFGNNRFFRDINVDDYVLALSAQLPNGDARSECGRRRILQELETTCLPQGSSGTPRARRTSSRSSLAVQLQAMPFQDAIH